MTNIHLRKIAEKTIQESRPDDIPADLYYNRLVDAMDTEDPNERSAKLLIIAADILTILKTKEMENSQEKEETENVVSS